VNLGLKARREAELRLWKSPAQLSPTIASSEPQQTRVSQPVS
jgi:hypothetical protein